jgi:hypothetical protein
MTTARQETARHSKKGRGTTTAQQKRQETARNGMGTERHDNGKSRQGTTR